MFELITDFFQVLERARHPFQRSGAAFQRSGAAFQRSGAAFQRSGAAFQRSGAAFQRSGAAFPLGRFEMTILLALQFACRVNLASELDGQRIELENIFLENEPREGVGWILIAMDGNDICNIGRSKSDIRNMKNQNFEISEVSKEWSGISKEWSGISKEWSGIFELISPSKRRSIRKKIRVAHGRPNFCFQSSPTICQN